MTEQPDTTAEAGHGDTPAAGWRDWIGTPTPPPATESTGPQADPEFDDDDDPAPAARPPRLVSVDFDDDDPMAPIIATMRRRTKPPRSAADRAVPVVLGIAGVTAVAVVAWMVWPKSSAHTTNSATHTAAATTPSPASVAVSPVATTAPAPWCSPVSTPAQTVGNGPGDYNSGPGVILLQQHALYVDRDADKVRSALAPGAIAATVDQTRTAIAAIPPTAQYCVTIVPTDTTNRWTVHVQQHEPDAEFQDTAVTARQPDGRVLITSITGATS